MQTETNYSHVKVLAGLFSRTELAAEFDISERTVIRWEHAGLPVIRVGMLRRYDPVRAREWVLSHESRPNPPKIGRPRKQRAA